MKEKSLILKELSIFTLLWFAYGGCYLLRRPFGIIKSDIQDSLGLTEDMLGYLDFAFSLPYAICSLFLGYVGDTFGDWNVLAFGLLGSATASSVMGRTDKYYKLCLLLFSSGIFQAVCWPAACSIIASWFSKNNISSIMAIFGSCTLVGNICGSFLTVVLESKSNWRDVFTVPSAIVSVIGMLIFFFGMSKKSNVIQESPALPPASGVRNEPKQANPIKILSILRIPTVLEVSFALSFIKGLKTGVMFWMPLYLTRVLDFNKTQSGMIPLTFEVGGLIGSILIIVILDKIFKMSDLMTCACSSLISGIAFLLLMLSSKLGVIYLHLMLFISGAFSSIVEITLCGSLPSKIGEEINAKTSVVGVVNGIGSLGNVIEGPIIAWISSYLGIQFIIPLFVIFCFLSFLCTLKAYLTSKKIIN